MHGCIISICVCCYMKISPKTNQNESLINSLYQEHITYASAYTYGLLTKLVRSRWLDIGQVFFFTCLWLIIVKMEERDNFIFLPLAMNA